MRRCDDYAVDFLIFKGDGGIGGSGAKAETLGIMRSACTRLGHQYFARGAFYLFQRRQQDGFSEETGAYHSNPGIARH